MHRIKELRTERGLTQAQLGSLLGVQPAAVSKYETNLVPLTEDTIYRLCSIFNVTSDYLLGLSDTEREPENKATLITDSFRSRCNTNILKDIDTGITYAENSLEKISSLINENQIFLLNLKFRLEDMVYKLHCFGIDNEKICEATSISLQDICDIIENKTKSER